MTFAALKHLLPCTILELGDDRMSLREFYRHIYTCRNVYCKLCGCSTSLKYLLKCKFPATNNKNNRPHACMNKPFPGRETPNLFGVALLYWPLAVSMPPTKVCPQSKAAVPVRRKTCECCDYVFRSKQKAECNLREKASYETYESSRIRSVV